MIKIKQVTVTYTPDLIYTSPSLPGVDAAMRENSQSLRYEYEIIWEDGTKHLSRSRQPSITAALSDWMDHFTKLEEIGHLELAPGGAGISKHLYRLCTELETE